MFIKHNNVVSPCTPCHAARDSRDIHHQIFARVSFYPQFIKCSKWENVLQFLPRRVVFIMLKLSFVVEIPIGRSKNSMQVRRWNDSSKSLQIVHFILTRAGISNLWLLRIWWPELEYCHEERERELICMQRSDKCDAELQDTLHHGQTRHMSSDNWYLGPPWSGPCQ